MRENRVEAVPVPASLAARAFTRVDYADAYRVRLPGSGPHTIDAVTQAAVGVAPGWAVALMQVRDVIAGALGLKTARSFRRPAAGPRVLRPGDRLEIFRVYARRDDEILLGEDDRHLDFRVSVLIQRDGQQAWVLVATVVRFNSWLGRAYFLPVRPFHRLLLPALLRNGLRRYAAAPNLSRE
jgi:hypothetical protein